MMLIVFAHPDGKLPNAWYRAYKRARRTIRQAGYDARVDLFPINALPATTDVLVAPPELAVGAATAGVGQTIVAPSQGVQAELDWHLAQMAAEGRLDHASGLGRATAVHVGFMPVHDRARVAE